jgi:hypothetical protein
MINLPVFENSTANFFDSFLMRLVDGGFLYFQSKGLKAGHVTVMEVEIHEGGNYSHLPSSSRSAAR